MTLFESKIQKILLSCAVFVIAGVLAVSGIPPYAKPDVANAVSASSWDAGMIIDDSLFYDNNAMTRAEIQIFLNTLNPSCDTWGTKKATANGYPNMTRAEYAAMAGWHKPPYICLKSYYQVPRSDKIVDNFNSTAAKPSDSISGAAIIKRAADTYGISPKALLVLLRKESAGPLTHDTWPLKTQYKSAMGYACFDYVPCEAKYAGFYNQMMNAARQLKLYKDYASSYKHQSGKSNRTLWFPDQDTNTSNCTQNNSGNPITVAKKNSNCSVYKNSAGKTVNVNICGYSNVTIKSKATAGLYNYTPYQPNKAALNAYPGEGNSCSAYGNRNFWFFYNEWFGSTQNKGLAAITSRYESLDQTAKTALGTPGSTNCTTKSTTCRQTYQDGAIIWSSKTGAWESYGKIRDRWGQLGYQNGTMGYPTGGITPTSHPGGFYQRYQNGYIIGKSATGFWESKGTIRTRWGQLGYQNGTMGYPTGKEVYAGNGVYYQAYEVGYLIGASKTGFWESYGPIRTRWGQLGYQNGTMGYPTGPVNPTSHPGGFYQRYQRGYIIGKSATGFWESRGAIRTHWAQLGYQNGTMGYPTGGIISANVSTYSQTYENGTILNKYKAPTKTWTIP